MAPSQIPDVAIVGAGVQGLGAAQRLAQEGLTVLVLERQRQLGGVWRSWANSSSRVQVSANFYQVGRHLPKEDYAMSERVLAELKDSVEAAGVKDLRLGTEVVRVEDREGEDFVRLSCRPSGPVDELGLPILEGQERGQTEEVLAKEVIFCTGGLQRPRRVTFLGEDRFGGPVVYGVGSHADKLDLVGKRVVIVGMGAFGVENARTALYKGAAHVDLVARHRNLIISRFGQAIMSTADQNLQRGPPNLFERKPTAGGAAKGNGGAGAGAAAAQMVREVLTRPFEACSAVDAMPRVWKEAFDKGAFPEGTDSPNTVPTCSDVFFIGSALGRIRVHKDRVASLEESCVVLESGERLQADVVIKNLGFERPDFNERFGCLCEVSGRYRPPIWISRRVLQFRTEPAPMDWEDLKHRAELYNLPASAPFLNDLWTEIYLHYRARPKELRALLDGPELPSVPLSKATFLEYSRGLHVVLSKSSELREKVKKLRSALNTEAHKFYSPRGIPDEMRDKAWVLGFLHQNRLDWREDCRKITGNPDAVPYVWEDFASLMGASKRPSGKSAL